MSSAHCVVACLFPQTFGRVGAFGRYSSRVEELRPASGMRDFLAWRGPNVRRMDQMNDAVGGDAFDQKWGCKVGRRLADPAF